MSGQKATTEAKFPKFVRQEMKYGAAQARGLYDNPGTSMIPQLSTWTQQGIGNRAALAGSGQTVAGYGSDEAMKTLSGGYLDVTQNPSFQRNMQAAMGAASGRFAGSGRVGSGAYAGAIGDAATGVAAQMYNAERDRQTGVLSMLPELTGAQYADAAMLEDAGRAVDEDAMARFDWPYARLDRYMNTIYGSPAAQNPSQQSSRNLNGANFALGLLHPMSSREA
jgi:hypothetical protein